jgi:electron transfer flavoprotein alpha subunit
MGTMNIAFVLSQALEAAPLWDLIDPIKEAGDRVEFWLPGPASEVLPAARSSDIVICGGADIRDIRFYENCLRWLEGLCAERQPGLILFPASLTGRELGARLAARLNRDCFPETRVLFRKDGRLFARKKVCGSNLEWDAEIGDYPAVLTAAAGKKTVQDGGEGAPLRIESRPMEPFSLPRWILDYEHTEVFPAANPLETAPLIFAAGRGVGSKAACERLRRTAGRFGAPLGFSRPAALNGWGGIGEIVGQSGVRCGAEVCIAVGVSGAAAFMAGIEAASTLIAVNPDRNAPIFRYADIGIIANAEEFIAALEADRKDV